MFRRTRAPQGATSALRLPKPAQLLEFTGERFSPIAQGEIEHEHYHRYLFARQFCHDKKVLDIACGEGYGCALLATVAREVTRSQRLCRGGWSCGAQLLGA